MDSGLTDLLLPAAVQLSGWMISLTAVSLLLGVLSLWGAGWVVSRLPEDYFLRDQGRKPGKPHNAPSVVWLIGKNLLGFSLIILGILMLIGPGQGLLMLLLGISLSDFPGKQQLVLAILRRRTVQRSLNWIRRRSGKPPLRFPERPSRASQNKVPQA